MELLKSFDIALGMIVVYLTFSLGVTAMNEGLAAVLSSRANWLRKGISALLTPAGASGLPQPVSVETFYRSPFISFLGQASGWRPRFAPSYIPRWTLLQGLLDTAQEHKGAALDTLERIKAAAERLPENAPIRVAVLDMLARADQSPEKFKALVDEWLRTFEEQVRSWYRQKTQYVLLLLSATVVAVTNLDTIALFKQLSVDTKTRTALVERALQFQSQDPGNVAGSLQAAQANLQRLLSDSSSASEAIASARQRVVDERSTLEQAAVEHLERLRSDGLQVGWSRALVDRMQPYDWVLKIFGLLLSSAALSLGAPFWFDLLQKVASVRSVGASLAERAAKEVASTRAK